MSDKEIRRREKAAQILTTQNGYVVIRGYANDSWQFETAYSCESFQSAARVLADLFDECGERAKKK